MSASLATDVQIKVAIVDDDEGIRTSLAEVIRHAPSFRLAGDYPSAEVALQEIPRKFMMLTVYEDSDSLFNSLKAGASGYLLKRTASSRLLDAIRDVHAGGSPMTPQLARRVVQYFSRPPEGDNSISRLTAGEKDFLDQLAKGYAYKEIADRMKISIDTVRSYVRTVYEKLHVHSRTEAVVKYLRG